MAAIASARAVAMAAGRVTTAAPMQSRQLSLLGPVLVDYFILRVKLAVAPVSFACLLPKLRAMSRAFSAFCRMLPPSSRPPSALMPAATRSNTPKSSWTRSCPNTSLPNRVSAPTARSWSADSLGMPDVTRITLNCITLTTTLHVARSCSSSSLLVLAVQWAGLAGSGMAE